MGPILMKVVEMAISQHPWRKEKGEQAKLTLTNDGAYAGLESLRLFATLEAGVPSPFVLGARIRLVLDLDHIPAVMAVVPEVQAETVGETGDEEPKPTETLADA